MKKTITILTNISVFLCGCMLASLWINHDDLWRYFLPIILIVLTIKSYLKD